MTQSLPEHCHLAMFYMGKTIACVGAAGGQYRLAFVGRLMKILLVEDDETIARQILSGLKLNGIQADHAADGEAGLHLALDGTYDAAVVDIMMPRLDGLGLIERLREAGNEIPVLILSAKVSVDDRVRGLRKGGDDYLTKPFSQTELIARLEALVRRARVVPEPTRFTLADIDIDVVAHRVTRNQELIDLQPREFALLAFLVRNRGRVVSKATIMDQVWGYNFDPQTNVVESRISRLRDKIDAGRDTSLIRTIRGAGYIVEEH